MFDSILLAFNADFHLWMTFGFIMVAVVLYATEKLPMEITSLAILCAMLMFFHFFPLNAGGGGQFSPDRFLLGFANPALIAVLALLIMGQAIINTGSLNMLSRVITKFATKSYHLSILFTLVGVMFLSGFINNTPTCVVFIPIMLAIAREADVSPSKVMMPLSYASIFGGTMVLIGSSTNLLVSGVAQGMGFEPLGMFDFTFPGLIIGAVGLIYFIFILPRLLVDRAPLASQVMGDAQRHFVIQLEIDQQSELVGRKLNEEDLLGVEDVTVKMLQRHEHAYITPFDDNLTIQPFDVIVLNATKESLMALLSGDKKKMLGKMAAVDAASGRENIEDAENLVMSEVLVAPASRMIGQNIEQLGFFHNTHCTVLGIQRRSRMITTRMTEIRLAAGDVMLVMGPRENIAELGLSTDVMVMESSMQDLPSKKYAFRVNLIFAAVVASATLFAVPIYIGAFVGAMAVIVTGCLNTRQAARALDGQIILLVAAGIAMGTALQVTGGAAYLADALISATDGADAVWVMSALFLLMAISTNVLSNNATALIFTPIAINTAELLNAPPEMFIHAVIFAANCCSLASPIGYQTNLLVMGPGHYKFVDYIKAGIPLSIIVWMTYTAFAYYYY